MKPRIAVIGSGPIGLEAALAAKARGYPVTIYERGDVADSVQHWGHVRMFSPFSANASPEGIAELERTGRRVPAADAILSGKEFAEQYLIPLGKALNVRTHHQVRKIARDGALKDYQIGEPSRGNTPFRLLVENTEGENYETADVIFDCSGTFLTPNPLGDAGIPALGETSVHDVIRYGLGEIADFKPHANRRTLVVGGGHTAHNAIAALAALQKDHPDTRIEWVSVQPGPLPCARIPDDPFPERDKLAATVNALLESGKVIYHENATVYSLCREADGIAISLRPVNGDTPPVIKVDLIIAATGYRPDRSLASELQAQTCWATEGTYKLAAVMLGETGGGGDCAAVVAVGAETLTHPEPGYYALGMKSYGRTPNFLLRTGREHIASLLDYMESHQV